MPVNPNRALDNPFDTGGRLERPAVGEAAPMGAARQPLATTTQDAKSLAVTGQQVPIAPSQASLQTTATVQQTEDDNAIDKECVSKAKVVVQQTSTDPYRQTKELGKVKAELLKRRYGKDLKISEG